MWRNYLSAGQVTDQLRRFVQLFDNAAALQQDQIVSQALNDTGNTLIKLKEQLLYDNRYLGSFAVDFVSRQHQGMELLMRTIALLQRMLVAGSSERSSVLRSATSRRRKAAVAEADCLECIKLLLEKTNSWAFIMDYGSNLELILFSLNSPQLDSKCYALEISTMMLRQPSGFLLLLRSLTVVASNNRDENRFTPIIAQLKHGLHTGKVHIQILVMRLLNTLRTSAPSDNYALLVQIESENAGFSADRLERVVREQGGSLTHVNHSLTGADVLQKEIAQWRGNYTPITVLAARRALANTSLRPSLNSPRSQSRGQGRRDSNQSMPANFGPSGDFIGNRSRPGSSLHRRTLQRADTNSIADDFMADTSGDDEWANRNQLYDFAKNQSAFQPINSHRDRSRRGGDTSSLAPSQRRDQYNRSDSMPIGRAKSESQLYADDYNRPATASRTLGRPASTRPSREYSTRTQRSSANRSASATPVAGGRYSHRQPSNSGTLEGMPRHVYPIDAPTRSMADGSRPLSTQPRRLHRSAQNLGQITEDTDDDEMAIYARTRPRGNQVGVKDGRRTVQTISMGNRFTPINTGKSPIRLSRPSSYIEESTHTRNAVDSPPPLLQQGQRLLDENLPQLRRQPVDQPRETRRLAVPPPVTTTATGYRHHNFERSAGSRTPLPSAVEASIVSSPKSPTGTSVTSGGNKSVKMTGFSYLFPQKPVTDTLEVRDSDDDRSPSVAALHSPPIGQVMPRTRAKTPTILAKAQAQQLNQARQPSRPRSAPDFDDRRSTVSTVTPHQSVSRQQSGHSQASVANVVHIPVRVERTTNAAPSHYRPLNRGAASIPADDVHDALSKFDYLNDYETSSRGSRF